MASLAHHLRTPALSSHPQGPDTKFPEWSCGVVALLTTQPSEQILCGGRVRSWSRSSALHLHVPLHDVLQCPPSLTLCARRVREELAHLFGRMFILDWSRTGEHRIFCILVS